MQIGKKMIEGITSSMYYESKILEVLSLISQRHQLEQQLNCKNTYLAISQDELYLLKNVGKVIRQTPISPPSIEELCKISTMSQTKLRELFKNVLTGMDYAGHVCTYGVSYLSHTDAAARMQIADKARGHAEHVAQLVGGLR